MILSAQSIQTRNIISPFNYRSEWQGPPRNMSYGCGPASYDVRLDQTITLYPNELTLASTIEQVDMPNDVAATIHDKSTLVRLGITVQNTFIDPGFIGYVTLELTNHTARPIDLMRGCPIAQFVFHLLDKPTLIPYNGKYQNQRSGAVEAL